MPGKMPEWYHKEEFDHVDDVVEDATSHWHLDNILAGNALQNFEGIYRELRGPLVLK